MYIILNIKNNILHRFSILIIRVLFGPSFNQSR